MKTKEQCTKQVARIADRILALNHTNPSEARKAARWFALWVKILNQPRQKEAA